MKGKTLAVALVAAALPSSAAEARLPPLYGGESTAYCLTGKMADGTYTRRRSVASNWHPLGTRIRLVGKAGPGGLRKFVVRDRIGYGSDLDFWVPSCWSAIQWGRRERAYKIGWKPIRVRRP